MIVAVVLVLTVGAGRSLAVDQSAFELDGNAEADGSSGDDWDLLYGGKLNPPTVFTFVDDPAPQSIFTGGGSKDIYDISKWAWKDGSVPDKDNITNAYAASYIAPADNANVTKGDLLVYFGCDRFAVNGDAFLAFWFFQDRITLKSSTFNGQHKTGDILVLVNFPQGANAKPAIKVAKWNPAKPTAAQNLELIVSGDVPPGNGAVCTPDGNACATTNLTVIPAPWPYTPKSGTPGFFPPQAFFEGGVNLTKLLGSTPCFSSFLCESRSSEQFTAVLKDFVLGEFPVCGISVTKACQVSRLTTKNDLTGKFFVVTVTGEVTNTGGAVLPAGAVLTVTDTPSDGNGFIPDNPQTIILQTPLPEGGTVPFEWTFFSNQNAPNNTVNASITFGGATVVAEPCNINCTPKLFIPDLTVDKTCTTKLVTVDDVLAVQVHVVITVKNTGQVPLIVTATDPALNATTGNVLDHVLMAVGQEETIEKDYLPSATSPADVAAPCTANFSDTVTAIGTSDIPTIPVLDPVIGTANCPLCDKCN